MGKFLHLWKRKLGVNLVKLPHDHQLEIKINMQMMIRELHKKEKICIACTREHKYLAKLNISSFRIVKHMNVTYDNLTRTWWAADIDIKFVLIMHEKAVRFITCKNWKAHNIWNKRAQNWPIKWNTVSFREDMLQTSNYKWSRNLN